MKKKKKKLHFHVKMDFTKLVHYVIFKSPLKYISCYEMVGNLHLWFINMSLNFEKNINVIH
jgi:hypothetical protein